MSNSGWEDPGESRGFSSEDDWDTSALREPETSLDDVCVTCRQGFHDECDNFWVQLAVSRDSFDWVSCCCGGDFDTYKHLRAEQNAPSFTANGNDVLVNEPSAYFDGFNGVKNPEDYADPMSAGRKQAARLAPIPAGMVCEWAWLAEAGGGVVPIIGCPGRPASDRHHGPDKNTFHNNVGVNLHRICDWCHNQWHAKNDPHYGPRPKTADGKVDASVPFVPEGSCKAHDPISRASDKDVYAEDALRREEARRHGAKI